MLASLIGGVCLCGGERAPTRGGTAVVSGQWSVVGGQWVAAGRGGFGGWADGGLAERRRGAGTWGVRRGGAHKGRPYRGFAREGRGGGYGWGRVKGGARREGVGGWVLVSRLWAAGRVIGLRERGVRRGCGGGRCGGNPPHKGSRLRLTAPKDKERGERGEERGVRESD